MDMICRKTMMRCPTPNMCAPFQGCSVPQAQQDVPTDADAAFIRAALDYRTAQVPQDANAAYVRLYAAASALFAPAQDAEREDAERMDYLESLRQRAIAKGFQWDNWHFDAKQSDLTIRQQIDAARAQRAAAQGDGDGR